MVKLSENIKRHLSGESTGVPNPFYDTDADEANADLPVFLDSMLFYLHIQADSYSQLVPYFYEPAKAKIIPGGFRSQLRWFAKHSQFDTGYTSILKSNRKWFGDLTGDVGLRDVVTHESGILGVGWAKPQDGLIEPRTSLYRRRGVVEENVFEALKEITAGGLLFSMRHTVISSPVSRMPVSFQQCSSTTLRGHASSTRMRCAAFGYTPC